MAGDNDSVVVDTTQAGDELPTRTWMNGPEGDSHVQRPKPLLRRHKRPLLLFIFYAALLLIPWIITCILIFHPLGASKYPRLASKHKIDHQDADSSSYSSIETIHPDSIRHAGMAIRVMFGVAAVVTMPIISGIVDSAVVVQTQHTRLGKKIALDSLFGLADRIWQKPEYFALSDGLHSSQLWFVRGLALLTVIGGIIPPLELLLVDWRPLQVAFVRSSISELPTIAGDPEPASLSILDYSAVLHQLSGSLKSMETSASDTNRWLDCTSSSCPLYDSSDAAYMSSVPYGTDTGVLRQHALRIDSSVSCGNTLPNTYCSLSAAFSMQYSTLQNVTITVCASGKWSLEDTTGWPFTASRNRQQFTESLFIVMNNPSRLQPAVTNLSISCDIETTMGYFELPNLWNNHTAGPLLQTWPTIANETQNFDDLLPGPDAESNNLTSTSSTSNHISDYSATTATTSPVRLLADALFGNLSLFGLANNQLVNRSVNPCIYGALPLDRYRGPGHTGIDHCMAATQNPDGIPGARLPWDYVATTWTSNFFTEPGRASEVLIFAMEQTNKAILTTAVNIDNSDNVRNIKQAFGETIVLPYASTGSIVSISVLIGIVVCGLLAFLIYGYSAPVWTKSLDALAMARIGASLSHEVELHPIRPRDAKLEEQIHGTNSIVAFSERPTYEEATTDTSRAHADGVASGQQGLAMAGLREIEIGGEGIIPRRIRK